MQMVELPCRWLLSTKIGIISSFLSTLGQTSTLGIQVCPSVGGGVSSVDVLSTTSLEGETPLELATFDGRWALVGKLLDLKADINTVFSGMYYRSTMRI